MAGESVRSGQARNCLHSGRPFKATVWLKGGEAQRRRRTDGEVQGWGYAVQQHASFALSRGFVYESFDRSVPTGTPLFSGINLQTGSGTWGVAFRPGEQHNFAGSISVPLQLASSALPVGGGFRFLLFLGARSCEDVD
jgi:hypothetical protein